MSLKRRIKNVVIGCVLTCSFGVTGIGAAASDDLALDGFYEYDFETGQQTTFDVAVPDDDVDELTMDGYAGALSGKTELAESGRGLATASSKKKTGWVEKGSKYYYRNSKGKYLKNGLYKVGKYYYFFDKKGVSCTGKKILNDCVYVMNKKTRRCTQQYFRLVVREVEGKNLIGRLYGRSAKTLFCQSWKGLRIEDQTGKLLKNYEPQTGDVVRVYIKKAGQASIPEASGYGFFSKVYKLRVVKRGPIPEVGKYPPME